MFVDISGRTLPTFSWTATYISSRGQFSFIFYTSIIFGEILEHCYLDTLKKTWLKIFCYQKQYRHSIRTVGDSQKEHNTHTPLISLICSYRLIFLYYKCLYTYYPSCSLSDLRLYDTGENFIYGAKLVFNHIVYILPKYMFKLKFQRMT